MFWVRACSPAEVWKFSDSWRGWNTQTDLLRQMSDFRWLKTAVPPCGQCHYLQCPLPPPRSATFLRATPDIWFSEKGFTPGAISRWQEPTSWAPSAPEAYRDTAVPVATETPTTLRSNLVDQYLLGTEECGRRTWERNKGGREWGREGRESSKTNNGGEEREVFVSLWGPACSFNHWT